MQIFPAIDLMKGSCVRLRQGDFSNVTRYESDPSAVAAQYKQAGAKWLHLVDLDGARDPKARQTDTIAKLIQKSDLQVQVGGGIRNQDDIDLLLGVGASRVVIGSLAVTSPDLVRSWLVRYGRDRIVLAFDVILDESSIPFPAIHGWQTKAPTNLWKLLLSYRDSGLRTILCTDVSRDGMMQGPNISLYQNIIMREPSLSLLASGGVSGPQDITSLQKAGLSGVIAGKALYEGKLDLAQAIQIANGGRDAR